MLEPAHIAGAGLRETSHGVERLTSTGSSHQLSAAGVGESLRQERLRVLAPVKSAFGVGLRPRTLD